MKTVITWGLLAFAALGPSVAAAHALRHRHHLASHRPNPRVLAVRGYGRASDPTTTCRYPDGTPFDPDIIGGLNHVGDGGPAANLGGSDPCGF